MLISDLPAGVSVGSNALGPVYFRDQYFGLDHRHGRYALEAALACEEPLLARLGAGLTPEHIRGAAFLDIETGIREDRFGTFAFLIGVGTFQAFGFRLRQFFLVEPADEHAMLAGLAETLDGCKSVVTYNGRIFDLPHLAARYDFVGLPDPHDRLAQIDLLEAARRLYAGTLDSCRLGEIERSLLGFKRTGDVPSQAIPDLYASFVRRRDARGLHPVFQHNSHDVLSLVALLARLNKDAGRTAEGNARHHLSLGKWDDSRQRASEAEANLRRAWELDPDGFAGEEAVQRLARALAKAGAWEQCLDLWQQELARTRSKGRRIRAGIALARLYERRLGDGEQALRVARETLSFIEGSGACRAFPLSHADLLKRVARLERRLKRQGSRRRRSVATTA